MTFVESSAAVRGGHAAAEGFKALDDDIVGGISAAVVKLAASSVGTLAGAGAAIMSGNV